MESKHVPGRIGAFLRWWTNELLTFVPAGLRAVFRSRTDLHFATLHEQYLAIYRSANGDFEHLGDIPTGPTDTDPQLFDKASISGKPIVLVLPDDRLLRHGMTLPIAAEEDLREAARYEMERRTPFTASDAYYDVTVRARDSATGQIEAMLYVVPRPLVDESIARLKSAGLHPTRASVADANDHPDPNINFLPADGVQKKLAPGAMLAVFLGMVTLALAAADLVMPVIQKRAQLTKLSSNIIDLRKKALEAGKLRVEIEQLTGARGTLNRERSQKPPVTAILDELTKRLPDNTWLNQLRLKHDEESNLEMSIFGFTDEAPRLIEIIESSPAFTDATIPTPVRPDPKTGKERFHIKFRIVGAPKS